ncbi:MAG: hypothetical protein ACUVRA_04730 [Candidatus Bathyarchaeaceae archaeon]
MGSVACRGACWARGWKKSIGLGGICVRVMIGGKKRMIGLEVIGIRGIIVTEVS